MLVGVWNSTSEMARVMYVKLEDEPQPTFNCLMESGMEKLTSLSQSIILCCPPSLAHPLH